MCFQLLFHERKDYFRQHNLFLRRILFIDPTSISESTNLILLLFCFHIKWNLLLSGAIIQGTLSDRLLSWYGLASTVSWLVYLLILYSTHRHRLWGAARAHAPQSFTTGCRRSRVVTFTAIRLRGPGFKWKFLFQVHPSGGEGVSPMQGEAN